MTCHDGYIKVYRYVESLSRGSDGANPYARIALALRSLTVRPLGYHLPPDEDWVVISYRTPGGTATVALPWRVYFPFEQTATGAAGFRSAEGAATVEGLDRPTLVINNTWLDLFSRTTSGRQDAPVGRSAGAVADSRWKTTVSARTVHTAAGDWGYLRIYSFEAPDSAAFVQHVEQLLETLPQQGVIVDLRANPGGTIPSGEGLARLFSPRLVSTQPVSFRNTAAVRALGRHPLFLPWQRSLDMQLDTGDLFSQGFSLTPDAPAGQGRYPGRVVLIVDALCYSTTDFLTATMQDNGLATVIGVDPVTGAGGANAWTHQTLTRFVGQTGGSGLSPLPGGMDISIPLRRSVRVGPNAGLPVEGLGVLADLTYALTPDDVLGDNRNLIEFAGAVLASRPSR